MGPTRKSALVTAISATDGFLLRPMEREQIWRKVLDGERAWLLDVMKCVESFGKRDLTLDEVHAFERHLEFVAHGNYRLQ